MAGAESSGIVLFRRIQIGESQYKGGSDRLENRCIAITLHFFPCLFFYFFPVELISSGTSL